MEKRRNSWNAFEIKDRAAGFGLYLTDEQANTVLQRAVDKYSKIKSTENFTAVLDDLIITKYGRQKHR
jgi:hypothetical protein